MKIIGKFCQRSFLVTADVVGLYPRIPHNGSILALKIYKYIFLTTQDLQPFIWLCYIDNIFFMWTHGEVELKKGLWRN